MSVDLSGDTRFDYALTGQFPLTQAPKTIALRYRAASASATQGLFNATNETSFGYQLGTRGGQIALWSYGGAALVQTSAVVGDWTDLVYTYDGTTHALYKAAVLSATSTAATQSGPPTLAQIGGNNWSEDLVGSLEDVRIYNRALSADEVSLLFHLKGRDNLLNGLVSHWPMINHALDVMKSVPSPVQVGPATFSAGPTSLVRPYYQ